jgi:hypothetical protein
LRLRRDIAKALFVAADGLVYVSTQENECVFYQVDPKKDGRWHILYSRSFRELRKPTAVATFHGDRMLVNTDLGRFA